MTEPEPHKSKHHGHTADTVAIILAVSVGVALNVITVALLWTAVKHLGAADAGLSENGTQLLTGAFGGIIGVLGSYVGFRYGERKTNGKPEVPPKPPDGA